MQKIGSANYIDLNVGITAQNHKIYQIDSPDGDRECGPTTAARLFVIDVARFRYGHDFPYALGSSARRPRYRVIGRITSFTIDLGAND